MITTPFLAVVVFSTVALKTSGNSPSSLDFAFTTLNFTPTVNTPVTGDVKTETENKSEPPKPIGSKNIENESPAEKPTDDNSKESAPAQAPTEQIFYSKDTPVTTQKSTNSVPAKASSPATPKTTSTASKPTQKSSSIDYSTIHLDDQGRPIANTPVTPPTVNNDGLPDITEDACPTCQSPVSAETPTPEPDHSAEGE